MGQINDDNGLIYTIVDNELVVGTNTQVMNENKNALPSTNPPTKIVIPESVQNYKVTKIGKSAFRCSDITSVLIASTITSIGGDAFAYSNKLRKVRFAEGSELTSLLAGAFFSCPKLNEIRVPPKVTTIQSLVFGLSNFNAIYYCGSTVFEATINIFGHPYNNDRYFPKRIFVKEGYSSNKFGDCENVRKTNLCSVPIHEPTQCSIRIRKNYSKGILILSFLIVS